MEKLPVRLALLTLFCCPVFAQVAQVRHAPSLNGTVEGSIQQMTAENTALNGGAGVTGDLLILGTPTVQLNGNPAYRGTLDGAGAATPTNHKVTLNGSASLRHVIRRTDAVTLPTVAAPPAPTGSAMVVVTTTGQSVNWSTARDVTLNSGVGNYAVPAGTYGDFTANAGSSFTLGVAGATTPAVYSFQHLTLIGTGTLTVVGPVIVTLANGVSTSSGLGNSAHPDWLALNFSAGGLALSGNASAYGYVTAPSGPVTISGNAQLVGGLIADQLTINGNGLLRLLAPPTANQPPTVALTAPADGATFNAPASFTFTATAADADGTVTKVEFFQGGTKLGEDTTVPYTLAHSVNSPGTYTYTARATDNLGATADSAAVTITVTSPNQPPTVALTSPIDGTLLTAPADVLLAATASDSDGAIGKVEFYQGTTKLAESFAAPFTFPLTLASPGTYVFSARAYDLQNLFTVSTSVTVTVVAPNQPPTVSLTAPPDGASFTAPAAFTLTATAADSDGLVTKVEFFQGATKLGEDAVAPYEFALSGLAAGNYSYLARATDNTGSATDSAPVTVTVSPSVSLALPFLAGFEPAEGYTLGPVSGQNGWTASSLSIVTDADFASGARSVLIPGNVPPLTLSRAFDPHPGQAVVFVDLFTLPQAAADDAASMKLLALNSAQVAFVRSGATGRFEVFNGDGAGGGSWQATSASIPVDAAGYAANWVRVTLRLDYTAKKWDLYVGGVMAATGVGFAQNTQAGLGSFTLNGQAAAPTLLDDFLAAFDNPLFADADHNGLPDSWEAQYFGHTGVSPTADADGDGVSTAAEYAAGSNPVDFYNGRAFALNTVTAQAGSTNTVSYTYDASGRIVLADYSAGKTIAFTHTSASNLAAVVSTGIVTSGPDPIIAWRTSYGLPADGTGNGADTAILANDGLPNLAKYAFGLAPNVTATGEYPAVKLTNVSGGDYLTLTYARPEPAASDLTYTVQVSGDSGATWTSGTGATVNVSTTISGNTSTVVVRDATATGSPNLGRRIRLLIERRASP